jgi:hypothetical protein
MPFFSLSTSLLCRHVLFWRQPTDLLADAAWNSLAPFQLGAKGVPSRGTVAVVAVADVVVVADVDADVVVVVDGEGEDQTSWKDTKRRRAEANV